MALKRNGGGTATKERSYAPPADTTDDEEYFEEEDTDAPEGDVGVVPALRGWDAAKGASKSSGGGGGGKYPDRLTLKDGDEILVKFIGDEPMTHYTHWVNKKGYTCLRDENFSNADCPLCRVGDEAKPRYTFTVAEISEESAVRKSLECGPQLLTALVKIHENKRLGPLSKNYVILTREGSGYNDTSYDAECVRARDLEEEFSITPEQVDGWIEGMEPCGPEILWSTSKTELQELASKLNR